MLVTLSGIVSFVTRFPLRYKLRAYDNGFELLSPKLILHQDSKLEIFTFVKPVQPLNAKSPMVVTLSGMVVLVNPLQLSNA